MKKTESSSLQHAATDQRVCFVYKEDYPWDVRVEKILTTLAEAGYEMSLVCRNNKRLPLRETGEGFEIHRLPVPPAFLGRLGTLVSVPFYFNPFWLFWLWKYTRRIRPQVMIVRDLPLMPIGIMVSRLLGCRIVFDMAECYPEMYASTMQFSDNKLAKFIFKNPTFAGWVEKFSFRHADHVFVMIEESRDRLIRRGAAPDRVTIVSNTPSVDGINLHPITDQTDELRLLYVGFVTRIRGLDNVLYGIRSYLDVTPDPARIVFDVVGIGGALSDYRLLSQKLDLADRVTFHGWCEQSVVDDLYERSDVGVLTYHVCSHWNHTIPNKLFDYMQAGMPVLATDVLPIKRIVEDIGCGMVFSDNDAAGCAECLTALCDPSRRSAMSKRGTTAIRATYNWEADTTRMRTVISNLPTG